MCSMADVRWIRLAGEALRHSEGPAPVKKRKGSISYGPYTDLAPFSFAPLDLEYSTPTAPLTVREYTRTAYVGHWSPLIHVQEDVEIHNAGPK